jgi:hypothetical protein
VHNEELHNLYALRSIIRMNKSRRMRWAGYVARIGSRGMHIGYGWESRKEGFKSLRIPRRMWVDNILR